MSALGFKNSLGVHPQAMQLRAARAEVLANNLANTDTPHFKAKDFDFVKVLEGTFQRSLQMKATDPSHLKGKVSVEDMVQFRNPYQPSIDGNTVDSQMEQSFYMENSLNFNASFQFLNGKFKGLTGALRGE